MTGGGLIQILNISAINEKFTFNPELTFFKKVYVKHAPFIKYNMNIINTDYNRTINYNINNYGMSKRFQISQKLGDLLTNLYVNIEITGDPDMNIFIRGFAAALIKKINIIIGGQLIESINSDIINIYNEIWYKEAKRQYNDYLIGNKIMKGQKTFNVRLPFFFSRSHSKALRLYALSYHSIFIDIELRGKYDILKYNSLENYGNKQTVLNKIIDENPFNINVSFSGEFIMLSPIEKSAINNIEYVVPCFRKDELRNIANFDITNSSYTFNNTSNLIVAEWHIIFKLLDSNNNVYNNELLKYVDIGNNTEFMIKLNGNNRFGNQKMNHFLIEQNNLYHSNIPRTKKYIPILDKEICNNIKENPIFINNIELLKYELNKAVEYLEYDECQYIYTYSNALNPENNDQPTGGINCSALNDIQFIFNKIDSNLIEMCKREKLHLVCECYANYFNILKNLSGMGGLMYSNSF